MAMGLGIPREDIDDLALLAVGLHDRPTVKPSDFRSFLQLQHFELSLERCDEVMSDLVHAGRLRQIGPGLYAPLGETKAVRAR